MRFSFQPFFAYEIETSKSPEEIHQIFREKFNSTSTESLIGRFYHTDTSYIGYTNEFRIERNIRRQTAFIDIVAIGEIDSTQKTKISIQYEGYLHWVTQTVCWVWTVVGGMLGCLSLIWLFKGDWKEMLTLLGIALVLTVIPQFIRYYYLVIATDLHNEVVRALSKSSPPLPLLSPATSLE